MPSDIERIRELALKETARRTEELKIKEESLADEARRLARVHLSSWAKSIERAVHGQKSPKIFYFLTRSGFFGEHWEWKEYSDGHPSIRLSEFKGGIPLDIYSDELSALLGEPFRVLHRGSSFGVVDKNYQEGNDHSLDYYSSFSVFWE